MAHRRLVLTPPPPPTTSAWILVSAWYQGIKHMGCKVHAVRVRAFNTISPFVLFADGQWYVMGSNLFGELGIADWEQQQFFTTPKLLQIPGSAASISAIAFGAQHSLCIAGMARG